MNWNREGAKTNLFLGCVCKILLHVILRSEATKNLGFCRKRDQKTRLFAALRVT